MATTNEIQELRTELKQLRQLLVGVDARDSQGLVQHNAGQLEQVFGEKHITNVGGDLAKGNIDKREGIQDSNVYGLAIGTNKDGHITINNISIASLSEGDFERLLLLLGSSNSSSVQLAPEITTRI